MTDTQPAEDTKPPAGKEAHRLRIIVGDSQRQERLPLHEWLTRRALERELAGATVYRAEMGYGASSRTKQSGIGALSADQSIVVELIDSRARLIQFWREIEDVQALRKGIATLERVEVMAYRGG